MERLKLQQSLPEQELRRFSRLAARLLAGRPGYSPGGSRISSRVGQGSEFLDFRQYQHGDDLRAVDWRASARGRDTLVRRFGTEVGADWHIVLDASSSMVFPNRDKWRRSLELCLAFAYVLLDLGHRVGVIVFDSRVKAVCELGRGRAQYLRLLGILNSLTPRAFRSGTNPAACQPLLGGSNSVVLISDYLAEDVFRDTLERLSHQQDQLHVLQVNARSDVELTESGALMLEDVESGRRQALFASIANLEQAQASLAEHNSELRSWCARHHVSCTQCDVSRSWQEILLRHLGCGECDGA